MIDRQKKREKKMKKGLFIVFEGTDGCGKSTQAKLLCDRLALTQGVKNVYSTEEPQQTAAGGLIRDTFNGKTKRCQNEIAALFLCDRIDHNMNPDYGIKRYLDDGVTVISDRYYYSTFAYQSNGTNLEWLKALNLGCESIEKPDICFFIDTPPEICMERMQNSRRFLDRNEDRLEKIIKTRESYIEAFASLTDHNIVTVNGGEDAVKLSFEIYEIVKSLYPTT